MAWRAWETRQAAPAQTGASRVLGERTVMVGRAVVSDITYGSGARGSLLKRVTAITLLG